MTLTTASTPPRRSLTRAAISAVAVMALTVAHHLYGAAIYTAAFRRHVAIVALPVAAAIVGLTVLSEALTAPGRRAWARGAAFVLILAVPILGVGLYEGFYNHLVKNLVFLAGAYPKLGPALFPAPMYEAPGDPLFEVSGVLQFPVALVAARELWRAVRPDGMRRG